MPFGCHWVEVAGMGWNFFFEPQRTQRGSEQIDPDIFHRPGPESERRADGIPTKHHSAGDPQCIPNFKGVAKGLTSRFFSTLRHCCEKGRRLQDGSPPSREGQLVGIFDHSDSLSTS